MADKNYISQEERDILNYRPRIEYELDPIYSTYTEPAGGSPFTGLEGIQERVEKPSSIHLWNGIIDSISRASKLDGAFTGILNNIMIEIPPSEVQALVDAAVAIQAEDYEIAKINGGSLPFSIYRKALWASDSPAKTSIIDFFEAYQADVGGGLQAETYPHIIETIQDLQNLADFYRKGVFAQFAPMSDIPDSLSLDDPKLASLQKKESDLHDAYNGAARQNQILADEVRRAYLFDQGDDAFSKADSAYRANRDHMMKLKRKIATKAEISSMVDAKVNSTVSALGFMENIIGFKPYGGSTYEILYGLLRQYPTRQALENGLRKVQALLKLSIDGKAEAVNSLKTNLRGLAGRPTKQNIHKSLINGIHMKNEVFSDVVDMMNGLSGVPNNPAFDVMASHIVDSVVHSLGVYEEQAIDFHKIHSLDSELRRESLGSLVDKDAAREIYKLATKLLYYGSQTNTWPDKSSLSEWLTGFMDHEKLT